MKAKRIILFFLFLSALIPQAWAADFGEDDDYLGHFVDDYENDDYVDTAYNVVHNATLDAMQLNYTGGLPIYENFTEWVESDALGRLTQTVTRSTFTGLQRSDDNVYLYKDFGVNYFDDFSHDFVLMISAITQSARLWRAACWTLSQGIGDWVYLRDNNVESLSLHIDNRNIANKYYIEIREKINGVGWLTNFNTNLNISTAYYLTVMRVGTNFTAEIYSDSARTTLIERKSHILQTAYDYQYMMIPQSLDYLYDELVNGYVEYLTLGVGGYVDGYYIEAFNLTDTGIVLLTNSTIVTDTAITLEFSDDKATWVNHNGVAGHEDLATGFEAFDMRDLNFTNGFARFNLTTTDAGVTPLMLQFYVVNLTPQPSGDGLFPGLAIGISLLIIVAIYALEKRR